MDRTGRDRWFIAIVLMAHAIGFLLAWQYKKIYNGDSFEYIYMALNIKEQGFFYSGNPALPVTEEYMTLRTPGYPLFLLLCYLVSVNNWLVLVVQNVISVFNIMYLRRTLLLMGYQARYDWLLLLFIIAYPIQFIYADTVAPDILLQSCVLVYFRYAVRLLQGFRWRYMVWMSVALTVGLFIKPVLYPYAFVQLLVFPVVGLFRRWNFLRTVLICMIPVVCILSYSYINQLRTGKFHFSSIQSFNAVYYYYFYFMDKEGGKEAQDFLREERGKIAAMERFKDRYDYANERGVSLLKKELVPYTIYHLKHSARFFIDPGKGELDMFTGRLSLGRLYQASDEGLRQQLSKDGWRAVPGYVGRNPSMPVVLVVLLFNFLRLAGLVLFAGVRGIPGLLRGFVVLLLLYFAVITGPIANTHYVLPVSLIMCGAAVIGWQRVLLRKENRRIIIS